MAFACVGRRTTLNYGRLVGRSGQYIDFPVPARPHALEMAALALLALKLSRPNLKLVPTHTDQHGGTLLRALANVRSSALPR
jgi:hypothetical protein